MTTQENDREEAGKSQLTIGGDVSGQAATGDNVIQIGTISGGEVVFHPPDAAHQPAGAGTAGPALPRALYQRLRSVMLACGPFDDERGLAAFFVDESLSMWQHDIPEADSAGERVERVIAWLLPRETAGENGLVSLLRVLAGRYESPAEGCRQQLEALVDELVQQLQ